MRFVRVGSRFVNPDYIRTIQTSFERHKGKFCVRVELANPREYEAYEELFDDFDDFAAKLVELGLDPKAIMEIHDELMPQKLRYDKWMRELEEEVKRTLCEREASL